jgi:hypothetical protein
LNFASDTGIDMNRLQCQSILNSLELIRHFAAGGDIGHRAPDCTGKMMPIYPAKSIGLGSIRPDGSSWYLMLKPKYKYNSVTKTMDRIERKYPDFISDDEVIACKS